MKLTILLVILAFLFIAFLPVTLPATLVSVVVYAIFPD
jgi:hypothetical protein